ncbi:MAG: thioredoxin reductase [Miltoncostaeaceae bacterium]|nr:thioredoxin reductase [Miltoncostaeaceae bacterium]
MLASRVTGGAPEADPGSSPRLEPDQIERLRRYGRELAVEEGTVLAAAGDPTYDLVVLLDGRADTIEGRGRADERLIASFGPSEFLGELGLLTGKRVSLTTVMRTSGRVLRVPVERVRQVMAQEPELSEIILRAFLLRRGLLLRLGAGLILVGSRFDADTRRLLEVLTRNRLPSRWLDLERSAEAETLMRELDVPTADLPIIVVPGGPLLRNPSASQLRDALGLSGLDDGSLHGVCDLLVVGGGPGGLGAAVYGASEGLETVLVEDTALGGQAGTSMRIENYLGFPAGLSGAELAARATLQAQKFGVRIKLASRATSLALRNGLHEVTLDDGDPITARALIIATGAHYRRLPLDRLSEFEGVGVYYAATRVEAQACAGHAVAIVGGGNSAGQAALFLSRACSTVHLITRSAGLEDSMSRYLIEAIERDPRIVLTRRTHVSRLLGADQLDAIELTDARTQRPWTVPARGLFVFIGATPNSGWLGGQLAEDEDGFILTGSDIPLSQRDPAGPPPLTLESSRPGVFCIGDVRSGSVKRVAAAVGEASMAVRLVFERLAGTSMA